MISVKVVKENKKYKKVTVLGHALYDDYGIVTQEISKKTFNECIEFIIDAAYDFDRAGFFTPDLILKKDHNYIIFVEDKNYQLGTKKYAQALAVDNPDAVDGAGLYDFKKDDSYRYEKLESINAPLEKSFLMRERPLAHVFTVVMMESVGSMAC